MPADRPAPGSAEDWLRYAQSDLAIAKVPLPTDGLYRTLCFHAQQAAGKGIKAVLIHHGVEFPRIHSIARLIDLLPAQVPRSEDLIASARLTVYATAFRYPAEDSEQDVGHEEYREVVRLAERIVTWAKAAITIPTG